MRFPAFADCLAASTLTSHCIMSMRSPCWRQRAVALLLLGLQVASVVGQTYHVLQPGSPAGSSQSPLSHIATDHTLHDLHDALSVMQDQYFSLWIGKWTTAIDWTAAVTSTHLAATLRSLSDSLSYTMPGTFAKSQRLDVEAQMVESEINKYFGHLITYYFGQDYFAIRMQAFDDMLWVVLGWLEAIQLIKTHSERHYRDNGHGKRAWHAQQFIPAFAHRARVFYELAEEGWDWELCGGGMTWNPRLLPYKNAITNQLYISASVSMYLHFPGDDNCSPFLGAAERQHPDWTLRYAKEQNPMSACSESAHEPEYDPVYLQNAMDGYDWLANSGMRNAEGLYTDGFHIRGYAQNHSKTECDERNEMIYTYNQGVILSGLRGLWEATGNLSYLDDAHELVANVIHATGWTAAKIAPFSSSHSSTSKGERAGAGTRGALGANGILTELCDPSAACSQDGQTFKGIFFHHLTAFCAPLPTVPARKGKTHGASYEVALLHRNSCDAYAPWVVRNARAALATRDAEGKFGMWWGIRDDSEGESEGDGAALPSAALDYRNDPRVLGTGNFSATLRDASGETIGKRSWTDDGDPNERGRGRTVETQGGGVAVVRAMWEFLKWRGDYDDQMAALEL
ncbi:Six-hairpin glycosidase [Paraphaeosphaeria sporulosa]|uniref:Six-hairpin glycosidase n=1 Tax=Paraphaeosphaeria sporulosa TaxID=1460663 RepID=A0A177C628_9PLEO|nr:Six-hairpin glycosidase [Paraphaeosphaeria sporulosa]OAG02339.1 Six-hairpin glycosidase [Paraphaeosphaeria sporulosa]